MEWQEKLKSYLKDIGSLEEGEFNVYFELLVNSFGKDFKASEIAEKVSMNRSYVYNILSNLVDKGLVTIVLDSSPKSYVAQNPLAYVEKQIDIHETSLQTLKSFKQFIKDEIAPELDKIKQLTSTPVKETFFINSTLKLTNYVNKALTYCEKRIVMRISHQFLKSIELDLGKSIERLLKISNRKDEIRIICSISKDEEKGKKFRFDELIAYTNQNFSEFQIIIDDDVYLFNFQSNPFQPFGVGFMMKEPSIAESFTYSLISSFKQITYDTIPASKLGDLSHTFRNDKQFSKSLENLFSKGWKIFFAGSSPDGNYYSLIAPQKTYMQELRDAGIMYEPFEDDANDRDQQLDKIFNEAKTYSFQGALEGKNRFDIDFETKVKNESIEGFNCKVLEYSSKNVLNTPWDLNDSDRNNRLFPVKSRMVVFNYFNRAAVMTWALLDENLTEILKELNK